MTELRVDEHGIRTGEALLPWAELRAVGIRTTSGGPWAEDVFWMFLSRDHLIEIPGQAMTGARLQIVQAQLEGMDHGKVIRAMGCAEDRMFRVWHENAAQTGWDEARGRARFDALVRRLGGDEKAAGETFDTLSRAWGERTRRYHGHEHLAECLHQLDLAAHTLTSTDVVELALWFHDAVYVPAAADNEESSARLLIQESRRLRIDAATAERSAALVRATAHPTAEALAPEAALMLDVDLSILGSDPVRFLEYEYAIGEEFQDTPRLKFEIGRGRFLTSLLARPSIFHTDFFRERYEAVAREQLSALLRTPRYRTFRLTRWLTRPLHGERAVA
jgi:predicted metal-dependent HD superfamily phosphohydrolase